MLGIGNLIFMASLNYRFGIKKTRYETSQDPGILEFRVCEGSVNVNFWLHHLLAGVAKPGLNLSVPRFTFLFKGMMPVSTWEGS